MKSRNALFLILCGLFLGSSQLKAEMDMVFLSGFGYGTLSLDTVVTTTSFPQTMIVGYEGNIWKLPRLSSGVVFRHNVISYKDRASSFSGQNVAAGVNVGTNLFNYANGFVRLSIDYYPYNQMSVSSQSSNKINDQSFKHSSLVTLAGTTGMAYRVSYISELTGGQFNKHERLRAGFHVGSMTQQFTKKEVVIRTSRPSLSPEKAESEDVAIAATSYNVSISLGFAF